MPQNRNRKKKDKRAAPKDQSTQPVGDGFAVARQHFQSATDQDAALRVFWDTAVNFGRSLARNDSPAVNSYENSPAAYRIPQEIIDQIIDHLYADTKVLSTLALVSRSWLASARYHIFEVVVLSEHYERFNDAPEDYDYDSLFIPRDAQSDSDSDSDTFNPLQRVETGLSIVQSSPAIASLIQTVRIESPSVSSRDADKLIAKGFEFLLQLPKLRTLSMHGIHWPTFSHGYLPTILRTITHLSPMVERLRFSLVNFVDEPDFKTFVRAFRNISELSFSSVDWEGEWSHWARPPAPIFRDLANVLRPKKPLCLTQVDFSGCTSSRVIMEMVSQKDAYTLELKETQISWDEQLMLDFSVYSKFFEAIGPKLGAIELSVRDFGPDNAHNRSAIQHLLSKCRRLSSFLLDLSFVEFSQSRRWFTPMLETVTNATSLHLTEVIIHCFLRGDVRHNRLLAWQALDGMSNRARFPKLGKVHIVVNAVMGLPSGDGRNEAVVQEDVCKNLEQTMPKLLKAGMLDVRRPSPVDSFFC